MITPQSVNTDNNGEDVNNQPLQQHPSLLSLAPISAFSSHRHLPASFADHTPLSMPNFHASPSAANDVVLSRVRLSDISPYDGAPTATYFKAIEALSASLMRYNAAALQLDSHDAAVMRCGLDSTRLFFRTRTSAAGNSSKGGSRGVYMYRAGRALENIDSSPPCMGEVFKCMGKTARIALSAIARHLRLRSDVFNHMLDDTPLPANEPSSSVLVANYFHASMQNGKGAIGAGKSSLSGEVEKSLLTLISSDNPGLQVCDPNGRWFLADSGMTPGCLLLLTGKALSHATAGLRPATLLRAAFDISSAAVSNGRTSLAFRLMPQSNAILDCSPIAAAGHITPQSYAPISVSQFMDDLSTEEDVLYNHPEYSYGDQNGASQVPSLRSVLSDPLSGAFLEDAMVVSCGHSFGGLMLKKVIEGSRCTLCDSDIVTRPLIPNYALRTAAAAVKHEDDRRLFRNASVRKRRKEIGDWGSGDTVAESIDRGLQYPFSENEKVMIKGNRRTPDKFVGKEALITSQCLNGWYLLQIIGTGESVKLQYRSLKKLSSSHTNEANVSPSEPTQNSG